MKKGPRNAGGTLTDRLAADKRRDWGPNLLYRLAGALQPAGPCPIRQASLLFPCDFTRAASCPFRGSHEIVATSMVGLLPGDTAPRPGLDLSERGSPWED